MLTLKARLIRWLKNNPGFHASGDIQRLVAEKTTYTPRTVVRRLEELAEDGTLQVEYRKGHSFYRFQGESRATGLPEPIEGQIFDLPKILKDMDTYFTSIPIKV